VVPALNHAYLPAVEEEANMRFVLICLMSWSVTWATATAQGLRLSPKIASETDGYELVLARHAKPSGFDYAGLARDPEALAKLASFVAWVGKMPQDAPLADWLNAYNALVVSSVMSKRPLASVMDDKGFFSATKHQVAGQARTLDEVENQIVRPRFHDARVHFALNCAARSCPTLHDRAFRSESLDRTLNALTRSGVQDERHVRVTGSELELSALFFWFEADFSRDAGSVRAFLRRYAAAGVAAQISDTVPLKQREYDWALNQAR